MSHLDKNKRRLKRKAYRLRKKLRQAQYRTELMTNGKLDIYKFLKYLEQGLPVGTSGIEEVTP